MNIEQLFKNNREWIENKLRSDSQYFEKLAAGQQPKILYIGCSDSRVTVEEILGLEPGEAFVHRNVANLVNNVDLNVMSVINYALDHLNVDHVVICGHYNCGGVKAAMQSADLGILNPWLRNIRDVYRMHMDELNAISDEAKRYDRLVELNVEEQCVNVLKTAAVQRGVRNRGVTVHGWVFDLRNGMVKDLQIDFQTKLEKIREIFRLD
ncbi:carbonic anhydrase [Edaphocola flava]|jgi:carbonic anhydrase|uniref:carbonic anhydrase n=1 Tax=Edaphocola flava TaxID=2499629 RepID=UPI00100AB89C|nr:carbonic anhydrase [Edaphocola flava]